MVVSSNGSTGWTGADTAVASYYAVAVASAGDVWSVNLSQVMTLVADTAYEVSFKAKASVARTMVAGLGLNHGPWTRCHRNSRLSPLNGKHSPIP